MVTAVSKTELTHQNGDSPPAARRSRSCGGIALALAAAGAVCLAAPAAEANSAEDWNRIANGVLIGAREAAMMNIAIHDSLNAIDRRYQPHTVGAAAPVGANPNAAVAAAAYRVIWQLLPARRASVDASYATYLATIPAGPGKDSGIALGESVAAQVIASRAGDATVGIPYTFGSGPGQYQATGPGALVGLVSLQHAPFALQFGLQFDPGPPPALISGEYARDLLEVQLLGSATSTLRTPDQTATARFYNTNTARFVLPALIDVASRSFSDLWEGARMFALTTMAAHDAGVVATSNVKYRENLWRPVTAIRAADIDGNDATSADPTWEPLIGTPLHPEYVSGHSAFVAGVTGVLQRLRSECLELHVTSPAAPGETRVFSSLSDFDREVNNARVWGGVHYRFSVEAANRMGRQAGRYIATHALRPIHGGHGNHGTGNNGSHGDGRNCDNSKRR